MSDNKSYGGFNVISTVSPDDYDQHAADFRAALATGQYDVEKSYLSPSGAYVLFDKEHNYHPEEIEAAKALADYGIIVELTNEHDIAYATAIKPNGTHLFSEGRMSMEKLTYEQTTRSISADSEKIRTRVVKDALEHARDKNSKIAVLYDKAGTLHRQDIANGIKSYDDPTKSRNSHKFDAIIVISKDKKVYEWRH